MKLDVMVVAPHPDDAELGMGGAIMKMLDAGLVVGVLDLTTGEPTPYGSLEKRAAETAAATDILKLPWRENLGLPNRSLVADLEARKLLAEQFRLHRPKWIFAPYWQGRSSRPLGRHRAGRGGSILGEAFKNRHAGRAISSGEDLQLLLCALKNERSASLCVGHQRILGTKVCRDQVLPQPVCRRSRG